MVSNREDLQSDCKTVNAIVSALAVGSHSMPGSTEFVSHIPGSSHRRRSSTGKVTTGYNSPNSPNMSPPYGLPRPRSENNFTAAAAAAAITAAAIGVPHGGHQDGYIRSNDRSSPIFKSESFSNRANR